MPRYKDLSNLRFGRLFVASLDYVDSTRGHRVYWNCWCECGAEKSIRSDGLTTGAVQSCGCLGIEVRSAATAIRSITHGMSGTREYSSWSSMKTRCQDVNNHKFPSYGGRGIAVCDRWQQFANFFADMGPRPAGTSIDRIDVDGNYEPANCRWADDKTQRNNRRDSVKARG